MRKGRAKRAVTLIEMLLVISLIAVALGALSLPLVKAIKKERFEQGVDQLISKLTLAQELMLDFNTDVNVKLTQKEGSILCLIEADKPLPSHLEHAFNRYGKISGIEEMQFDNSVRSQLVICCDAAFGTLSQGQLKLVSGAHEETIFLKGYPSQIKRGLGEKQECQVPYPEEILSAL
jgi:prepilin-type N-terminal cleavage/methylation domain-containing protein